MDMVIENPTAHMWWRARLTWLMDNQPEMTLEMHQQGTLRKKLHDDQVAAIRLQRHLEAKGHPKWEAENVAFETEISQPMMEPEKPMSQKDRKKIDLWAMEIEDQESRGIYETIE